MDPLNYAIRWLKRPIFVGQETDRVALESLVQEVNDMRLSFDKPIAWAKINERGDLFDLRLQNNPYEVNVIPLYLRPDHAEQRQQAMQSQSKKS
jgi:hypothetical protein